MENTPTPYQRQRRASGLPQQDVPSAQPPMGAPVQPAPVQPVQPRVPVAPAQPARISYNAAVQQRPQAMPAQSAAPQQNPYGTPTTRTAAPQVQAPRQPYAAVPQQPAQAQPPQSMPAAYPVQQHTGNRAPRALQQNAASSGWNMPAPQPAVRTERTAPPASVYHAAPAGQRPHAAVHGRMGTADTPVSRREPAREDRRRARREEAPAAVPEKPRRVEKRKTPSWLLTVLSLLLIGVMALVAFDFLMQAYLKTAADEKAAAYREILNNYHITEKDDGTLRVTWQDLIEKYAEQYNLDPAFVTAVIRNESSFRTEATSSVGARGLMQMMPDTAEWVAGKLRDPYDFDRLYEAETSIRYGCWYLNYLSELFRGDTVLVCAAYHAGQGKVWSWFGRPEVSPDGVTVKLENIPIPETKDYVGRVTQAYGIYQTLLYPAAPAGNVPADGGAASLGNTAADR